MTLPEPDLTHFRLAIDADGIAVALIDRAGEQMNTLGPEMASDLAAVIDRCTEDDVKAVVIASAKPDNFLAGADVDYLRTLDDTATAVAVLGEAHDLLRRIEGLGDGGKPVVAAIHGPCLGGGLELALVCGLRIVSDDESATQLGLPEVRLGIMPGAGGTQRLPRLVGIAAALDMMLTGKSIRPRKALSMGLVDEVVPKEHLVEVARRRALDAVNQHAGEHGRTLDRVKGWLSPRHLQTLALEETTWGRRMLFSKAAERTMAETKGNYPAPEAILGVVRTGVEDGMEAGFAAELDEVGRLLATPQATALLGLFTDIQALKRDPGAADATPRQVAKIGVLGGGLMGGGIAAVSVIEAGVRTRIKEVDHAGVRRGLGYVHRVVDGRVAKRRMPPRQGERLMGMVTGTTDLVGFGDVDVVIEAVFEDLDLKRAMLTEIERSCGEHVIFASNTSSLPIGAIADGAKRPEQVIGMHYFSPVEKMPLLEVVTTDRTADWVTATCVALGKAQGKTVIVVNDGPGFYTTRILGPFMNEVGRLIAEGVPIEDIDGAMVQWGFPVGPVALIDEVGIDVAAKIGRIMEHAFGDRMRPPDSFTRLLEDDRQGRKNGRGFYRYQDGKRRGVDDTVYPLLDGDASLPMDHATIQDRLASLLLNEAARCLEDGVLHRARDGDVGAVLGLGFPPFRGGPFTWIDQRGAAAVVTRLDALADEHGGRYAPADILRHHAETGELFRR